LINSLVTILIPTNNSVEGLKTTIESLILQTRVKNTRVLVLDYGSDDGTVQYSQYASYEYRRILKIESIDLKENPPTFEVFSPYCLCLSPGVILENYDFIIEAVNSISRESRNILYYKKSGKLLTDFFPYSSIQKDKIEIIGIFCYKEMLWKIKNEKGENNFMFLLNEKITRDQYKMVGSKNMKF
jgi:hypothetical protein